MIRRPPRSTLFPTRRSSDLFGLSHWVREQPPQRLPQVLAPHVRTEDEGQDRRDRKSTRLNSSHLVISYAVFCLKKKKKIKIILAYCRFTTNRMISTPYTTRL